MKIVTKILIAVHNSRFTVFFNKKTTWPDVKYKLEFSHLPAADKTERISYTSTTDNAVNLII